MGIEYSVTIASGEVLDRISAHILKPLLGEKASDFFDGNVLKDDVSITDFYYEVEDEFRSRFTNLRIEVSANNWGGGMEPTIIIYAGSTYHDIFPKYEEYKAFNIQKNPQMFELTDEEKKDLKSFNQKVMVPECLPPLEFSPVVWSSIS